jgi:DNA invertase Pin-like site-specific DNA recombinase
MGDPVKEECQLLPCSPPEHPHMSLLRQMTQIKGLKKKKKKKKREEEGALIRFLASSLHNTSEVGLEKHTHLQNGYRICRWVIIWQS